MIIYEVGLKKTSLNSSVNIASELVVERSESKILSRLTYREADMLLFSNSVFWVSDFQLRNFDLVRLPDSVVRSRVRFPALREIFIYWRIILVYLRTEFFCISSSSAHVLSLRRKVLYSVDRRTDEILQLCPCSCMWSTGIPPPLIGAIKGSWKITLIYCV